MNKSSKKYQNIRPKSPSGSSLPLFLLPRNQKGSKARDTGPLPSLRELVGEHESVLTFTQSRIMGGCELVDFGSDVNARPNTEGRVDVDLSLIGLRPDQLWSQMQSTVNASTTLSSCEIGISTVGSTLESDAGWQMKNFYYQLPDNDLFNTIDYALADQVRMAQPVIHDNNNNNNNSSTAGLSDHGLLYFDLDTFQADIDLTRSNEQYTQDPLLMVDSNQNLIAYPNLQQIDSLVSTVAAQPPVKSTRKRKRELPAERTISCSQCPRKFRSVGHLKTHCNSAHPSEGAVSSCHCAVCGKGFCHRGALTLHMRRHVARTSESSDKKRSKIAVESDDQLVPQEFYV